jgi:hypothetical protein
MNASIDFMKDALRLLESSLGSLGFERRKPGILTRPMGEDSLGWIGLNKATRGQKGLLEINPVVGVRNQPIEKLVAEMVGEPFDEVVPATLAGNVGYLTPSNKYRVYTFSLDAPLETVASELVQDVRQHGLPFINGHVQMDAVVEGLRTRRFAIQFMADYRVPAGLYLLGRTEEAEAYLKSKSTETGTRNDATLRYQAFAAKLAERLRKNA